MYKQYYDFYNKNLDHLAKVDTYLNHKEGLNDDFQRRAKNPDSYDYRKYFDERNELNTLYGPALGTLHYKMTGNKLEHHYEGEDHNEDHPEDHDDERKLKLISQINDTK